MHAQVVEIDCDSPARALEALRKLEHLEEIALYGSLIHVVVQDWETQRAAIEAALNTAQITVNSMLVIPPSLEDVFIARARG